MDAQSNTLVRYFESSAAELVQNEFSNKPRTNQLGLGFNAVSFLWILKYFKIKKIKEHKLIFKFLAQCQSNEFVPIGQYASTS